MEFTQIPRGGEELPRERAYMNPRMWVIGALIGVLAIVVIILVVRNRGGSNASPVEEVINAIETSCSEEDCALATALVAAKGARNAELCKAIKKNEDVNECLWRYAYDMSDPETCGLLEGEKKETCLSNVYYTKASGAGDITICEKIPDENLKNVCQAEMLPVYAASGRCSEAGAAKQACETKVAEWKTFAERITKDLCEPFRGGDQGEDAPDYINCVQVIDTVDLDGDGLVIRKEFEIGTDNKKKDTDGDGFDDGVEVASGHDPLGR